MVRPQRSISLLKNAILLFICTGVSGVEVQVSGKTRSYALMVADTVLVKEAGTAPEVLTSIANKAWSDVAYFLKVQSCHEALKLHQL